MRLALVISLSVALAGLACTPPSSKEETNAPAPSSATAPDSPMAGMSMLEPVPLTESDVQSFVSAVRELRDLGIETKVDRSNVQSYAQALAANREAIAILERNGFTVDRFQRVTVTVGLAIAALETKGKESDKSRTEQEKALEKMKESLSPEQYEALRQQMLGASAMLDKVQQQPEGNLELVAKHREEIDAAFSRK